MGKLKPYAKFVAAALGTALVTAVPLIADGGLSGHDWLMIAASAAGAVGVLLVPNRSAEPPAE